MPGLQPINAQIPMFAVPYERASPLFALQRANRLKCLSDRCYRVAVCTAPSFCDEIWKCVQWSKELVASPPTVTGKVLPKIEAQADRMYELVYGSESKAGHIVGPDQKMTVPPTAWESGTVTVHTLVGKKHVLEGVRSTTTGMEVRARVQDIIGVPPSQQRIIANGLMLMDHQTLGDIGVPKDGDVHLVMMLRGGMFHVTTDSTAGSFGMTGRGAQFEFEFDTDGEWAPYKNLEVWGSARRPTTGIQLNSELTLGELTDAVVKYTIENKIPMPVGFKILPWGWDADEDPPPGLPIGPCNFFVISV